jgi:hypothetical protein
MKVFIKENYDRIPPLKEIYSNFKYIKGGSQAMVYVDKLYVYAYRISDYNENEFKILSNLISKKTKWEHVAQLFEIKKEKDIDASVTKYKTIIKMEFLLPFSNDMRKHKSLFYDLWSVSGRVYELEELLKKQEKGSLEYDIIKTFILAAKELNINRIDAHPGNIMKVPGENKYKVIDYFDEFIR